MRFDPPVTAVANHLQMELVDEDKPDQKPPVEPGTSVRVVELSPNRTMIRLENDRRMHSVHRFNFQRLPKKYPAKPHEMTPAETAYVNSLRPRIAHYFKQLSVLTRAKGRVMNARIAAEERNVREKSTRPASEPKLSQEAAARRARVMVGNKPTIRLIPNQIHLSPWTQLQHRSASARSSP